MNRSEQSDYKSTIQDVVPSTRFGQGLASLFYLKRHKKCDKNGRTPVVSRLRIQSKLANALISPKTMPFEITTRIKTTTTPSPTQMETRK